MRPGLCHEALRLGRVLAQLAPDEPEVHGLVALMEIQSSRMRRPDRAVRRAGPAARPGPGPLGSAADPPRPGGAGPGGGSSAATAGPYVLQAAIAACHARAFRPEETDWARITALYGVLAEVMPSPIVELNRAVAVSMAFGPQAGLDLVDQLAAEPSLRGYHLLPSVRGDLLMKLGRAGEAQAEFRRASELTRNARERELSEQRARSASAQTAGAVPALPEEPPER